MPLYEYLCSKCGEKLEVIQKFADAPLTVHEGCGGTVERLISLSGSASKAPVDTLPITLRAGSSSPKKDSGDDLNKTKTSQAGESKPAESKSTESKSSEAKTESKPASTSSKTD